MTDSITQKTILNGGLTVLSGYVPDEATEYYFVNIEIGSGSSDDNIDGQAHFLEHMLFNGIDTEQGEIDYKTLKQTKEAYGIRFSAYTTESVTRYYAMIPKSLGLEGVKHAVHELSRMVVSPSLPEERIEHEKDTIRNEWGHRQGNIETYLYEQSQIKSRPYNSCFSHRVLGEKNTIEQITRESLIDFMAAHYTQPNTSIAVTGPIDHNEIVKLASELFSDMPTNQRPDYPEETPIESYYEVSEIGFVPHSFFQIRLPWLGEESIEAETTIVLAEQLIVKRLNDVIREEGGQVYGLGASANRNRFLGDLIISSSSEPHTVNDVIRSIGMELNRLVNGDVLSDLESIKLEITNMQKASATTGGMLVDSLTDINRLGGLYTIDSAILEIEDVTIEDIQELYKQSLSGGRVFVGVGPEGSFMPQAEFDQIMRLQETREGRSLRGEFKPQGL